GAGTRWRPVGRDRHPDADLGTDAAGRRRHCVRAQRLAASASVPDGAGVSGDCTQWGYSRGSRAAAGLKSLSTFSAIARSARASISEIKAAPGATPGPVQPYGTRAALPPPREFPSSLGEPFLGCARAASL